MGERDEFGRDRPPIHGDRRQRIPTPPERRFADAHMFRGRGGRYNRSVSMFSQALYYCY